MKTAKPAPMAIHGWTVFAHPLFMAQVEALVEQVETIKKKDPTGYVKKNATKRLAAIRQLALSDQLPLDGFKGRKLSFRSWNGQLRQPIPLVHPRALVSNSPQDGFLHPSSELDSLGFDQPEVSCDLAGSRT